MLILKHSYHICVYGHINNVPRCNKLIARAQKRIHRLLWENNIACAQKYSRRLEGDAICVFGII